MDGQVRRGECEVVVVVQHVCVYVVMGACLRGTVQQLRVYELLVVGQVHRQAVLVHLHTKTEPRDKRPEVGGQRPEVGDKR